jgi:hypothetical protein
MFLEITEVALIVVSASFMNDESIFSEYVTVILKQKTYFYTILICGEWGKNSAYT